jgi:putative oxidoreductase
MSAIGLALLRLALAAVCLAHGTHALFGWWGSGGIGPGGLTQEAAYLAAAGLKPAFPLAALSAVIEVVSGALLAAGWFTRIAAIIQIVDVGIGTWTMHAKWGFFLNYTNDPMRGQGMEYWIVMLAALACLVLMGPGAISLDGRRATKAASRAAGRARLRGKM